MKKTIFLLNIDNYEPEITARTLPLIRYYAEKIGAEIVTITERKFPDWPVTYEKLQIHELARQIGSDWNIYIDLDCLINPECIDFTAHLSKDTVMFHSTDVSDVRFASDKYFKRDGRHIAPGNWFMIASDWCLDLWKPLAMTPAEAVSMIHSTAIEKSVGIDDAHLVDDFALAHNIAQYGLKVKTMVGLYRELGLFQQGGDFFNHQYTETKEKQLEMMDKLKTLWHLEPFYEASHVLQPN